MPPAVPVGERNQRGDHTKEKLKEILHRGVAGVDAPPDDGREGGEKRGAPATACHACGETVRTALLAAPHEEDEGRHEEEPRQIDQSALRCQFEGHVIPSFPILKQERV